VSSAILCPVGCIRDAMSKVEMSEKVSNTSQAKLFILFIIEPQRASQDGCDEIRTNKTNKQAKSFLYVLI